MKLYEKMRDGENLSWCRPFVTKDEKVWLIRNSGEVTALMKDGVSMIRPDEETLKNLARIYNEEDYNEWINNEELSYIRADEILTDVMKECGCAECPYRDDCECMDCEDEDEDADAED